MLTCLLLAHHEVKGETGATSHQPVALSPLLPVKDIGPLGRPALPH